MSMSTNTDCTNWKHHDLHTDSTSFGPTGSLQMKTKMINGWMDDRCLDWISAVPLRLRICGCGAPGRRDVNAVRLPCNGALWFGVASKGSEVRENPFVSLSSTVWAQAPLSSLPEDQVLSSIRSIKVIHAGYPVAHESMFTSFICNGTLIQLFDTPRVLFSLESPVLPCNSRTCS